VTMAAGWCGERAPRPWWGHMEIRPDHWWEKVGQGAPPRRGARGGSEPGWVSHDPHDPHHTSSVTSAATMRPTLARPRGEEHRGGRQAARRRTVVGLRRVRER
jgi:hypothetical protein